MSLVIAVRLLSDFNDAFRNDSIDDAKELIKYFVYNSVTHYGEDFSVYNIHSLLHLPEDVQYFDTCLYEISAYPFENYLQHLKK